VGVTATVDVLADHEDRRSVVALKVNVALPQSADNGGFLRASRPDSAGKLSGAIQEGSERAHRRSFGRCCRIAVAGDDVADETESRLVGGLEGIRNGDTVER